MLRRVSFYRNIVLLNYFLLHWMFFLDSPDTDVLTVYIKHCDVVSSIWDNFRSSVS